MKSSEAKKLLRVFYSNSTATNEEVNEAYSYIPNVPNLYMTTIKKIQAINRYCTFNRDEVDYAINNSDDVIVELEQTYYQSVTPTIDEMEDILNPVVEPISYLDIDKPVTVEPKKKMGRPKKYGNENKNHKQTE